MSTKSFFWLVAGTLVVGVGIGAAISVVVALGDGAAVGTGQTSIPAQSTSGAILQSPDRVGPPSPDQLQEENQSGETSPAELGQLGQQPQGQAGQGGLESGAIEGDSLTGTIEKIEGDTVTLNTPQGLLQAITAADTTIQMFSQGTAADLDAGVRVTVIGQRGEDGMVEARSISVIPEGAEGLFGLGFAGRLGQNTDGQDLLAQFRERVQSGEDYPRGIGRTSSARPETVWSGSHGRSAPVRSARPRRSGLWRRWTECTRWTWARGGPVRQVQLDRYNREYRRHDDDSQHSPRPVGG